MGQGARLPVTAAANAINVVYCTYASARGHAQVGARLYLPTEWAADTARRDRAGVPDSVEFETKPQLAVDILTDLHTAGVLPPWLTGDEVYGRDKALRTFCEDRGVGYVLGVPCSFTIALNSQRTARADQALKLVGPKAWTRASAGPGSKGERLYAWAWIATASPRHHLLVRRNLADPTDQAYFYCYVPEGRPATSAPWSRSPGCAGPSRRTSRSARTSSAWTTARSASTPPSYVTSRWP